MKILVLGDVHGRWKTMMDFVENMKPDLVLQVGDFGYFPRFEKYNPRDQINSSVPIHWCDGNHEDHESLVALREQSGGERRAHEVAPNVFWQDRGSTLMLPDGRVALFAGGAFSIDKKERVQGRDWFPGEMINWADMSSLPDCQVDIVISHTCPNRFELPSEFSEKEVDPSRQFLDEVLERYNPESWYFGHWHKHMRGQVAGCAWEALDMLTPMFHPHCFSWIYD